MPPVRNKAPGPYACTAPGCIKTYGARSTLNSHVQSAHQGQSWRCEICAAEGKPHLFKDKSNFRRHVKDHQDDKRFHCEACTYKNQRADNFKRHLVNEHEIPAAALDEVVSRCDQRRAHPEAFAQVAPHPPAPLAAAQAAPHPPAPLAAAQAAPLPPAPVAAAQQHLPLPPAEIADPLLAEPHPVNQYPFAGLQGVAAPTTGQLTQLDHFAASSGVAPGQYLGLITSGQLPAEQLLPPLAPGYTQEELEEELYLGYQPAAEMDTVGDRQGQQWESEYGMDGIMDNDSMSIFGSAGLGNVDLSEVAAFN